MSINGAPADRFTLVHLAFGAVCAKAGVSRSTTFWVATGWEFAERILKRHYPDIFPHPSQDSFENAGFDIGAAMAGHWVASKWL